MFFFRVIQHNAILLGITNYHNTDKWSVAFVNLRRYRLNSIIGIMQISNILYIYGI